ncbi:MAG: DNA internalization-related competence protein ComEC/Rec2 [Firmicutes bacterium]|nr:DNA internalization-related competence protein ComEC/Rec2 [Bacillota bacterium]
MIKLLKKDYIYYLILIITIIFSVFRIYIFKPSSVYSGSENNFTGIINKIEIDGNKFNITIKTKETLIGTYYIKTYEEVKKIKNNYKLGDTVKINGNLSKPNKNTIPNLFNYSEYLYNNKVFWTIKINYINKIKSNNNLFFKIKNYFIDRINNIGNSKNYLFSFILGDSSKIDNKVKDSYQNNGISHLFAVSGMHVSLFMGIILFILEKLKCNQIHSNIIAIIFLLFYMFITNFSPSMLRAGILFILLTFNNIFKLSIKSTNIMILLLCIILIINPFLIFNIGFQFSYTISLFLIVFQSIITRQNNYFKKLLVVSIISFLISLPISIYNFYQVNLLGIFLNLLFVPLVSFIIFPLSLFTFIFPIFDNLLIVIINIMEYMSLLFNSINIFKLILAKTSFLIIIIYYVIIIYILYGFKYKNYKGLFILIFMLIVHNNIGYFNSNIMITMIDVGQGDSILIVLPYNKGNILIDTGGKMDYKKSDWMNTNSNNNITKNSLIPYFKSIGIKKINNLLLSHGDYDHMGEAINLVENFKVEKVIFNCGEFNELEQELIKVLDKKKIPYYSCIKELNIDDNKLYFLNNKDYGNENNNSSVIYTELNNHKFLFMSDAGAEVESDLIEKYNLQDIDVLKVGHHGSKTSSSKKFINEINPKYSIISVGKNNRYGHPNDGVLDNLKESKIYRTDQDGSIMFKIKNDKLKIETCVP